jgi:hypothetical protein
VTLPLGRLRLATRPASTGSVDVRLDVVGDARRDHSAFRQAQCAQRLALQLKARSAMPLRFVV